ncbi:tetratricopeptide repeat protein [Rhodobacteraceae bacterium RKSG542]|uniref:tetratricopeptide repeat protein n=1 Tax=Pseudovibrio flavus TaxID=2529854 RepID=UPI0012BD55E6|nr:tetratricopeptide repeat protein [Pseudovibrio flavus]MTI17640.1 tetratricopeptide repeat protein [Pseudovibrio flavus]
MVHSVEDAQQRHINAALRDVAPLEQAGHYHAALPVYRNLAERYPENIDLLYRTATILLRSGELREALAFLRKVLFSQPAHHAARANMGNVLFLLGELDEARAIFQDVLEVDPENRNALYGYGTILIKLNQHKDAIVPARALVEQIPHSAPALTLLGDAYSAAGTDQGRAILNYRHALRSDSSYVPALLGLSKILVVRRKGEEARTYLSHALDLEPTNAELILAVGHSYVADGEMRKAIETFEHALTYAPEDVAILLHLSVANRRVGRPRTAVSYGAKAWRLASHSREVGNTLGAALAAVGATNAARDILTAQARGETVPQVTLDTIARIEWSVREEREPFPPPPEPKPVQEVAEEEPEAEVLEEEQVSEEDYIDAEVLQEEAEQDDELELTEALIAEDGDVAPATSEQEKSLREDAGS